MLAVVLRLGVRAKGPGSCRIIISFCLLLLILGPDVLKENTVPSSPVFENT